MLENGFIVIHRSLLKWEWYDDINTCRLFLHLLLTANHYDEQWRGITINRGQRVSSYAKLAKETGLSVQNIRTSIKRLISTGELTHHSTAEYGLFTVVNYNKYQDVSPNVTVSQQSANSQPTVSQQLSNNTNKATNKETPISPSRIPQEISEAWQAYSDMRKAIKKPLTDRAITLAIGKLEKLAPNNYRKQSAILEQSTFHSWAGLFDLKDDEYEEESAPIEFIPPKPEDDAPFRKSLPDGASLADWLPPVTERIGGGDD